MSKIFRGNVYQLGGAVFLARVYLYQGILATHSLISSIIANCFDLQATNPAVAVNTRTLTVTSVMFNTLQTDASWTADIIGYNFADTPPITCFPSSQHRYRMEYKFTPATGAVFFVVFEGSTERTFTNG